MNEQREDAESAPYLPALTLGSGASKLIQLLRQGHEDVQLTREEMIKISTWIDSNGQFYGSYYGRKNIEFKKHPNFRPVPTFTQAIDPLPPLRDKER
jgi:hypothetical protein